MDAEYKPGPTRILSGPSPWSCCPRSGRRCPRGPRSPPHLTLRCRRAWSTGAFLLVKARLQPPAQQQGWTPSAWPPQTSGSHRSLSARGAVRSLPGPPLLFPESRPHAFKCSSSVIAHPQSRRPLCRVCWWDPREARVPPSHPQKCSEALPRVQGLFP